MFPDRRKTNTGHDSAFPLKTTSTGLPLHHPTVKTPHISLFQLRRLGTRRANYLFLVLALVLAASRLASATVTASLNDAFPNHSNGGFALQGDNITYTLTIGATGGTATNVTFDPNSPTNPTSTFTTDVAGSLAASPVVLRPGDP